MTNTPGDGQPPQDPYSSDPNQHSTPGQGQPSQGHSQGHSQGQPGQDQPTHGQSGQSQPGYWEQQSQQPGQQPGYGYAQPAPMQYAPDHPKATTVLVLGILGVIVCGLIAPFAWSMGKNVLREIDASNGTLGGRGAANAGYILGIVGTILLGIAVLFFVVVVGIAILGAATSSATY